MNGSILTGARVPYAMARDGLFFQKIGQLNQKTKVPVVAVVVQCVISSLLALSGSFDQLTDYVVFSAWIFYALMAGSVLVFRHRESIKAGHAVQTEIVYRVPFFPYLPILFILFSCLLLINTVLNAPIESGIGLVLIALGVPFYLIFKRRSAAPF